MGDCISTFTNIRMDPTNPSSKDIHIEDIAHALSMMTRANGHFKTFYSVAQHSINCANEAVCRGYSKRVQLACLLHDASEAYLSDITRPVKKHLQNYLIFEDKLQGMIDDVFNLHNLSTAELTNVGSIDDALLYYEFLTLHGSHIFQTAPEIISVPDFEERKFQAIENRFLMLFNRLSTNSDVSTFCGVDGCPGGWICAIKQNGSLSIKRFNSISELFQKYGSLALTLIDMPIGLPGNKEQEQMRPDHFARKLLQGRCSTVFPVPCRQTVYSNNDYDHQCSVNMSVLGKKIPKQTAAIIPKMREVDTFLRKHRETRSRLLESHPEVCFAVLNGKTVLSKKSTAEGQIERLQILAKHGCVLALTQIRQLATELNCANDDIIDAACLSVAAEMASSGIYRTLPEQPLTDEAGLLMQMVLPVRD